MLGSKRSLRSVMYLSNLSALACSRFTQCRRGWVWKTGSTWREKRQRDREGLSYLRGVICITVSPNQFQIIFEFAFGLVCFLLNLVVTSNGSESFESFKSLASFASFASSFKFKRWTIESKAEMKVTVAWLTRASFTVVHSSLRSTVGTWPDLALR